MIKIKQSLGAILAAVLIAGCTGISDSSEKLIGTWVMEIPGPVKGLQGMILARGGEAGSFNMSSLIYQSYEMDGSTLTLYGISRGNGGDFPFEESYTVKELTDSTLVLQRGDLILTYDRLNVSSDIDFRSTPLDPKRTPRV